MDGFARVSGGNLLFAEDFDLADAVPEPQVIEPEVIEPTYTFGEVSEAREAAWRDGHSAGLREARVGRGARRGVRRIDRTASDR
jgi:hypothetical protein